MLDVSSETRKQLNVALSASPELNSFVLPEKLLAAPFTRPGRGRVLPADPFAADQNGHALPVQEAARNLADRLEQVRSLPNQGKRDALGVRVSVDLELQGLRGVDLYLYWRLLPAGSNPVPENLAVATPACMITAGTDRDFASVSDWVPLPEDPGPYKVELLVTDGTDAAPLDSLSSEPFD